MLKQTIGVRNGQTFSLSYGKTCLVTSPQLVPIYCLIDVTVLAPWAQAIVNHLYWSIFTCGGNGKNCRAFYLFPASHSQ